MKNNKQFGLTDSLLDAVRQVVEKKLDPVGQADADIDNDGDVDSSDKYLHRRRKAIKKAMAKEHKGDKPHKHPHEEEQIDEISKDAKASYLKKAGKDHYDMFTGRKPGSKEKLDKRRAVIQKVSKALTGKKKFSDYDPKTKQYTNEDVNEGYEDAVMKVLSKKRIDGRFDKGDLYVDKRSVSAAKAALKRDFSIKSLPKIIGEDIQEAGALNLSMRRAGPMNKIFSKSKSDKDLAKEIEAYAKKHGGIDKASFMKVAQMLSKGQRLNAIKFAKKMDTDPRDWVLDKLGEAVSPAQQAAIAIAKKKAGTKPKNEGAMSRMASGGGLKTFKPKPKEPVDVKPVMKEASELPKK